MCNVLWNSTHAIRNVIIITITCNPQTPVATRKIDTQAEATIVKGASTYS
jgi:hypothetical protein